MNWTDWLLLLGFLMGWAVGLIQGSANLKARVQLAIEMESALPKGYRLDSEQGLVRDFESAQVTEMELG